ncbi:hypothetical protein CRG98_001570 [Punica granatum]|uniref:Uncharacterized protein n=1 Tax=Punica granatum TaxID=22663 RepID=A0A2I0LB78_PUNGR|nr:hypothetical protein CRG98_001570 [Punica granatum]
MEKSIVHKVLKAPKDVMVESNIEEDSTKVVKESCSIIVSKSPRKVKYSEVILVPEKEGSSKKSGVGLSSTRVAMPVIESHNYFAILNSKTEKKIPIPPQSKLLQLSPKKPRRAALNWNEMLSNITQNHNKNKKGGKDVTDPSAKGMSPLPTRSQ